MENKTILELLSDVANFNLTMFGISMSIFTVLYAFILSRKDSLRELSDIIKSTQASPSQMRRSSLFIMHTNKWTQLNSHLRNIVATSFLLYCTSIILKYQKISEHIKYISFSVFGLTSILFIYIVIILILVFNNYKKSVLVV
ncbi:hypothetical protein GCM10028774_01950 [Spirosoma jeollabukense]